MKSIKSTNEIYNEIHNEIHNEICSKSIMKSALSEIHMKSTKFQLKSTGFHEIPQNFTGFHEIHGNSQNVIKFNSISLKSAGFYYGFHCEFHYEFITNFTGIESTVKFIMKSCWFQWCPVGFHEILVKLCRFQSNPIASSTIMLDFMKFLMKSIMKSGGFHMKSGNSSYIPHFFPGFSYGNQWNSVTFNTIMKSIMKSAGFYMKSARFHEKSGFYYGFHCGFHSSEICNVKWNSQWNQQMKSHSEIHNEILLISVKSVEFNEVLGNAGDFMKSCDILDFMESCCFYKILLDLMDLIKSFEISGFHEILLFLNKIVLDFMKSSEIMLNFMKSCEILWIYENLADFSSNLVDFRWISDNANFIQIYYRFQCGLHYGFHLWISFVDFMDFIWNPLDSIWKTRRMWRISLESVVSYWFQVDFIMDFIKFNTILLKSKMISWDFQMTSWNPTGFYKE